MKDLPYIPHYIGARNDPKLVEVEMEMKGQGKAIWWDLVEMLWENGGYLPLNFKKLAYSLRYASAEEVERVVTGFGLFELDEERFWSKLILEFIEHKKRVSETNSNNRRGSRSTPEERPSNEKETPEERSSNGPSLNKISNKEINKINNNIIPPTAGFVYEVFFFKNMKDPSGEVKRFFKHYDEERHWTYQDGTPIEDVEKVVRDWKPAKAGVRFNREALNWYRAVYNAGKGRMENAFDTFLAPLSNIRAKGHNIALVYVTEADARKVADFIINNSLAGDYQLDFRVSN